MTASIVTRHLFRAISFNIILASSCALQIKKHQDLRDLETKILPMSRVLSTIAVSYSSETNSLPSQCFADFRKYNFSDPLSNCSFSKPTRPKDSAMQHLPRVMASCHDPWFI